MHGGTLIPDKVELRAMTAGEQRAVTEPAHARTEPVRLVDRARIILAAAEGLPAAKIAASLGCSGLTVYAWIRSSPHLHPPAVRRGRVHGSD